MWVQHGCSCPTLAVGVVLDGLVHSQSWQDSCRCILTGNLDAKVPGPELIGEAPPAPCIQPGHCTAVWGCQGGQTPCVNPTVQSQHPSACLFLPAFLSDPTCGN